MISCLQVGLAIGALVLVGAIAEIKSRELAIQSQRIGVAALLEADRTRLEGAFNEQINVLSRLAGMLAAIPEADDDADFQQIARALTGSDGAIIALGATGADGRLLLHGDRRLAAPLRRALAGADVSRTGTEGVAGPAGPALALWQPVTPGGGSDAARGQAVAIADTAVLFPTTEIAGLTTPVDLALVAAGGTDDQRRALHFGHGSVLLHDPVTIPLPLPGGAWTLAGAPRGGWVVPPDAFWPIRLLTLIAVTLVALPMLRTRGLVLERQRHIAELREGEVELRRLSQRLGLALDASQVGVWDFNIDTGELIWDSRMDELYAVPPGREAHSYADWQQRLHPDDLDRAQAEFADAIRTSTTYRSDYRLLLPDGRTRHIRAIGQPGRDAEGRAKIVGVNWDVTADVERRAELETRRREAEATTAAKSQFLATVSHEIRTPMNGVIGMLDLLLRGELDPEQRDRARIARRSAEHLLTLLNDVLDLSKLEADRITLDTRPLDPAALAHEVVALLSAVAGERDLALGVVVEDPLPARVLGDPTRLRQVMINLVGNAIKFTDAGSVELRLAFSPAGGGTLEVAVRDTGIGIPEAARRGLFERFTQVDGGEVHQRGGTGLGLAISKQLVELMGGAIAVESVEGLGSTFSFRIPAPTCTEPAVGAASQPDEAAPLADPPRTRPVRILVAEDNPTNQKVLLAYLEIAGHDVRLVANGAEAVAEARKAAYDLVLLDIQMPVMDGIEAARGIRAGTGATARAPILALTAGAAESERARFLAAGIDDSLTKPVTMQALFTAIARVVPEPVGDATDPRPAPPHHRAGVSRASL